ncbi:probable cytochrome P450 6a13 isoform X2 [Hermetia illucens]|uniref:probable cytochrome P450 6a13 isoform X2 n=1 Tax=Hermetia illucens TaxID=343691 RepID=UPI0018CC68A9|nr:probable cytochrome P450 6a13 isoform X2 [Hermetia illucens]
MAFLVILCTVLITMLTSVYVLFKVRYRYWAKRGVPCLEPIFPFGSLQRSGKRRHIKDTLDETYQEFSGKEPLAGLYFFTDAVLMVLDLDLIHNMLVRDFSKFHDRGLFYNERSDPLSANLLTLEGHKWKVLRSKLTPTFTSGKMKFMYPTILGVMDQFDQTLREILKTQKDVEIKELLARFTTDVIGTCAFGIECNSLKDPNTEFRKVGRTAFEKTRHGLFGRAFLGQFPRLSRKLGLKTTRDDVSDFFMKVVRETVEFREKNNVRRNDFMDILIQLKNGGNGNGDSKDGEAKLSFEEIAAQAFIFFLAGFETSSTNMTYSLYELAKNTEIQEKARREINEVLEKHSGEFTYDAMMEMTYIGHINNESLRKYPPASLLIRKCNCDYQIPNSDRIIEKGTRVLIPAYSIHRDPDIWPDPEVFDPERFAPEQVKERHPMAFLGFGDGPRNCIGARFGQMQSRIGLVSLLRNYRFEICDKTPTVLEYSMTTPILTPKGGLWLKVEAIEQL